MVALIAAYLGCLSGCASVSKIPMQPTKLHYTSNYIQRLSPNADKTILQLKLFSKTKTILCFNLIFQYWSQVQTEKMALWYRQEKSG